MPLSVGASCFPDTRGWIPANPTLFSSIYGSIALQVLAQVRRSSSKFTVHGPKTNTQRIGQGK
jgi:hypothetical protein